MRILGIILIILGLVMFFTRGFNFQTKENVADIGPVEINKTENHRVAWPMWGGGIAVVAGIALIIAGDRRRD